MPWRRCRSRVSSRCSGGWEDWRGPGGCWSRPCPRSRPARPPRRWRWRVAAPPLHEFLPDLTDLSVRVAVAEAQGHADEGTLRLLAAVRRLHEQNPMLGLRGVRLGLVVPGLFAMQVRAIAEAACERRK